MKYIILEAGVAEALAEKIEEYSGKGWILKGGVVVDGGYFYHAMTHPSDGAAKSKPSGDACQVCGKADCSNKLHSDIVRIIPLIDGMKNQ